MRKSVVENLEQLTRKPGDHPYDGRITEVAGDYVHVRLTGGERKILSNVIIADHISRDVLRRGQFCKVEKLYDRERKGRFILTAILPQIHHADYAGAGTGIPIPPTPSVQADCNAQTWTITWPAVECTYYELYWAANSEGSGATLITQTINRRHDVPFDEASPPKAYFAIKAVHGVNESNLSAWVTDTAFLTGAPLVAFGDGWLHGDVAVDDSQRWKVKNALVKESTNHGGSYVDDFPVTNPPNTWLDDTPVPTFVDLEYFQVLDDYRLARWQNGAGTYRGWLYDGANWVAIYDQVNLPGECYPIWMDVSPDYVLVTAVADGQLELHVFNAADLTAHSKHSFGAATIGEVQAKTRYLFPVAAGADWYVAGNFTQLPGGE